MHHSSYYAELITSIEQLIIDDPECDHLQLALKAAEMNYALAATIESYEL